MTEEDRGLAKMLLTIKTNAYERIRWTRDQQALMERCFEKEGEIRVLAACCVLSARRPEGCDKSLGILRETIESKILPSPYTEDRKSTRLNSSHSQISYAVFCLKKKKK